MTQCLKTKNEFDRVGSTKAKPTDCTVGFVKKPSDSAKSEELDADISNLTEMPNLYKRSGKSVSKIKSSGFIQIPRNILNDPKYQRLTLKHKFVFQKIIENVNWKTSIEIVDGEPKQIGIGQLRTTIRQLVDLCNEGICYKNDKIDKNIIERSVSHFSQIGLSRHEPRQDCTIITVLYLTTYEVRKSMTETGTETEPRQNRDTSPVNEISQPYSLEKGEEGEEGEKIVCPKSAAAVPVSKIKKKTMDGKEIDASLDDFFRIAVRENKDWGVDEINEVWSILVATNERIRDPYAYMAGTIDNLRTKRRFEKMKQSKDTGEKKCQVKAEERIRPTSPPPVRDLAMLISQK